MKRITFCALLMTLFLLMSCNNSASSPKDGQAAKSDGTLIDLATISSKITEAVAFAKSVKEIHTLVKSIDELAKAIGKKVNNDGQLTQATDKDKNESLVAGVYNVVGSISVKLKKLETISGISDEMKQKITAVKSSGDKFIEKVKAQHASLNTESDSKKAIDKADGDGSKGAKELGELNTTIDTLLTSAEATATAAINSLSTSTKLEPTKS
ncbi:Vsp/OspC family lipoprotein [Borrelia parkeri]|uniref:Vsp/OspC family lipoprotein n=1 Tax=Borrelia parkeri TaxID=141 RepID=UPI001FF3FCFF|nr:Vsp/OspC family lipoprotein [Borrelia parkeri]